MEGYLQTVERICRVLEGGMDKGGETHQYCSAQYLQENKKYIQSSSEKM